MRKAISKEIRKENVTIETRKNLPALDDTTIRDILRSACRELEEDVAEAFIVDNIRMWIVQTLTEPSEPNWVDPEFLKEKADLLILWSIYAQKHVVVFDQEAKIMGNWEEQPLW